MIRRVLILTVLFGLAAQGAWAQRIEEALTSRLDAVMAEVGAEITFDALNVDEGAKQATMTGVKIAKRGDDDVLVAFDKVIAGNITPHADLAKSSIRDMELIGIRFAVPKRPSEKPLIARVAMRNGNILDLIPELVEKAVAAESAEDAGSKIGLFILSNGEAEELTIDGLRLVSKKKNVSLDRFSLKGLRKGICDVYLVSKFAVSTPGDFDLKLDEVEIAAKEYLPNGLVTKFQFKVTGLTFTAGDQNKTVAAKLLAGDTFRMNMVFASDWNVQAKTVSVRPFIIDSPGQFKLDMELDIGGMPSPQEYDKMLPGQASPEAELMQLIQISTLIGFKIRLEERGMIDRLLQMGAMMSGLGDKGKLIAMVEQQGKPRVGMFLGLEIADDMIAKLVAFLKEGGNLTIELTTKSAPLGIQHFQEFAAAPDKVKENLDVIVTHAK